MELFFVHLVSVEIGAMSPCCWVRKRFCRWSRGQHDQEKTTGRSETSSSKNKSLSHR